MKTEVYDDHGVRFGYPADWQVEVTDEGPVTTIDLEHPGGIAFALVRTDESRPDPAELANMALEAMREEYPALSSTPVIESLRDHAVTGHDVEFFSLDIANSACIRSFRTAHRTVLIFGQWSDIGEENLPDLISGIFQTLEETED